VAIASDDGNPCTVDACNRANGVITHVAVSVDDGQGCTVDACNLTTGAITHVPAVVNDGNACTTDACDPVTGAVTHDAVAFDDNNVCTTDSCDAATGVKHLLVAIDDANACTSDACHPVNGITHTPVAIDDGNRCTTDFCDTQTGVAHPPVVTNDNDACTTDSCNAVTGIVHVAVNCDDGDPCTADSCNVVRGCEHRAVACSDDPCDLLPDNSACDAGPCAETGACQGGVCVGVGEVVCDDGDACTRDACDPNVGCVAVLIDDGDPCDDDNACSDNDTCEAGECGGNTATCAPPSACESIGVCNPATGRCDYAVDAQCAACKVDVTAPVLVCPMAVRDAECTAGGTTVALGTASATDACSTPSVTSDAPARFPLGTTTVTFTGTDVAGNRGTCMTTVLIADTGKPVVTCPAATTIAGEAAACGATVQLAASASDGCDGSDVTITGLEERFFGPGLTNVTVTATDASGNEATCETSVTVTELDDFSIICDAVANLTAPDDFCGWPEALAGQAVDECQGEALVTSTAASFTLGQTEVAFTATRPSDGAGASCKTILTVVDATKPTIDCGATAAKSDLVATFTPSASDACTATIVLSGAGCARSEGGQQVAVSERCEVAIEGGKVVVSDAPDATAGDVFVTYTVTATDPSGNSLTRECSVAVDPESLDHDGDSLVDRDDNCPLVANPTQGDSDEDGKGDKCDPDGDDGTVVTGGSACAGGPEAALAALAALVGLGLVRRRVRQG